MKNYPDPVMDSRLSIEYNNADVHAPDFAQDVWEGLRAHPKHLPSLYFYDERGSLLFEEICELPEYYITRAEKEILENHASDIVQCSGQNLSLVEFGSGSSYKTRLLIEAFLQQYGNLHYFPVDISESILADSARQLLDDYPGLEISAQVAEYQRGIQKIGEKDLAGKMVVFLGSNIGNFEPGQALAFLKSIRAILNDRDYLLLGTDMEKDRQVLEAAYNDRQGVTAEFNLNLLRRINRELGGGFKIDDFSHFAFYNKSEGRIEMHLRSEVAQKVEIADLNLTAHFREGETIHTENSYKYSQERLREICNDAGFVLQNQWQDARGYFSLNLLSPRG